MQPGNIKEKKGENPDPSSNGGQTQPTTQNAERQGNNTALIVAGCVAGALAAPIVAPLALGAVGFGAGGVLAGASFLPLALCYHTGR
jgi:hypothetical protein